MRSHRRPLSLSMALVVMVGAISAQTARPTFEVASIKRSAPNQRLGLSGLPSYEGETVILRGQTLENLIRFAYGIGPLSDKPFAGIEGEPRWSADRFDVVAKTDGPIQPPSSRTLGPVNQMMQSLLAERFKLVVHWEMRERPVYALVLVRGDRSLGPQLRRSTVNCDAYRTEVRKAIEAGTYKRPQLGAPREKPVCGLNAGPKSDGLKSVPFTREILMGTQPLKILAENLGLGDRPVLDRTGLTGNFDAELRFSPPRTAAVPVTADPSTQTPDASDPGWPSLAEGLRDQLGLKLESTRGPVEVLVIDSVDPPTEN